MGEASSLINMGELTKPATVLVERISDAVGGIFRPYQIKRVAKAEAEAEKIKALADIEISGLQHRALVRFIQEEGIKHENMESITAQSIKDLKEDAKPEDIEADWLTNFFDKCRLVSDKDMQSLWARLLASEANNPGTFSKRTVEFVSTLDKPDAQLFTTLCSFCWSIEDEDYIPIIFNLEFPIYKEKGLNYYTLNHLDTIGLINFDRPGSYLLRNLPRTKTLYYYGASVTIELMFEGNNNLEIGNVQLTKVGKELAPMCGSTKSDDIMNHAINIWYSMGYTLWSPFPKT